MSKKKAGTKGSARADSFIYAYVVFLFAFTAMLPLGLNQMISANVDIQPPTFQGFDDEVAATDPCENPLTGEIFSPTQALTDVSFTGSRLSCLFGSLPGASAVDTTFRIIGFIASNLGFFISLMAVRPELGAIGLVIFGPAVVMVLVWILRIVRGN